MNLTIGEVIQFIALPLLGWLTWELRSLRKELSQVRLDMGDRIHFAECNRRMEEAHSAVQEIASRTWQQEQRLSKIEGKSLRKE